MNTLTEFFMTLAPFAAIVALGIADRYRGDANDLFGLGRATDLAILGWLVAVLTGHPWDVATLVIMLAMALGATPGWGAPYGAVLDGRPMDPSDLEWWQFGPFKTHAYAALALRGAMWGACALPVMWFDPGVWVVLPAYAVAMPLALWLCTLPVLPGGGVVRWERSELVRGWIAGAVIWGLG